VDAVASVTDEEGKLCPVRFRADRISRIRRAVFAFSTTFLCIGGTLGIVFSGFETTLATRVAEALMSYAELMAMLYLGASVIDRAEVARALSSRWRLRDRDGHREDDNR
jgi:hypothetical protein